MARTVTARTPAHQCSKVEIFTPRAYRLDEATDWSSMAIPAPIQTDGLLAITVLRVVLVALRGLDDPDHPNPEYRGTFVQDGAAPTA
jgi:hypothetical protein